MSFFLQNMTLWSAEQPLPGIKVILTAMANTAAAGGRGRVSKQ